jgi:surface antigen
LQSKKEYKTKVAQDYWMDKYQQQYSYTIDEDWNIKISASWYGEIPESAFKTRAGRQEAYGDVYENSVNWKSYVQNLAWSIKDWSYGWQCGAFCNDVLVAWGDSKIFWNTLQEKIKACNVSKDEWPQVWYAVVFDLWFTSKDWENHGHVWIISNVNGDGSIDVLESNGKSDETIHVKTYSKATVDKMVMGYYKPSNYDVQKWTPSNYASYVEENADKPYEWVSKQTKTGIDVNAGWWITDLENEYLKGKWDNKDVMNQTLKAYWLTIQEYNAMKKKYVDYQAKVSLIEDTQKMYDAVKDLLEWNKEYSSKWRWSRHSGTIDRATFDTIDKGTETKNIFGIFPKFDNETANWINKYNYLKNSQLLDKYQQLKKAWATFWAMQKSEWDLVWSAASDLNWQTTDTQFEETLQKMLDHYGNILADAGVEWFYNTDI